MTVPHALAGLWAISLTAVVCIVLRCVWTDWRARAKARRLEEAREAAIQVRLAEDREVAWLQSIPVMPFDPEVLS